MKAMSLREIAAAVAGEIVCGSSERIIRDVFTDSRNVAAGGLFVALRGENFDGHQYIEAVRQAGAVAAIVDRHGAGVASVNDGRDGHATVSFAQIVVEDARRALGALGSCVRASFARTRVVAVAGSNGKTSTKHLVHTVLSSRLHGSMSPKSFNNDIGVPLTILPVDVDADDFVVLELGTNHPGEIATLGAISRPDVAVLTNCGEEHLEFLGDLDGVCAENASLVDHICPRGTLIVNGDDGRLSDAVSRFTGQIVRFGFGTSNDLVATDVAVDADATRFTLDGRRWSVPMLGRHNALNALAAIAVGRAFGIDDGALATALASSSRPEMRMERVDAAEGITILNDAYNANPASMRAGLETLTEFKPAPGGRRVAVLGDMRELGPTSERYHREAGSFVAGQNGAIDLLICVGEDASRWIADQAAVDGFSQIERFPDAAAAATAVRSLLRRGDLVLVKGSRGVRLERVVEQIVAADASGR